MTPLALKRSALMAVLGASCWMMLAGAPPDYAKLIIGKWESPGTKTMALHQGVISFHPDGSWGILPYGGGQEEVMGRQWRITGNKLFLTYLDGRAFTISAYTIVSCSPAKLVLEIDGSREEWGHVD
jgi:hypothetical protein